MSKFSLIEEIKHFVIVLLLAVLFFGVVRLIFISIGAL
jgi:hypothetical protein